jgi:hypothetical protein
MNPRGESFPLLGDEAAFDAKGGDQSMRTPL